jgi:hypothetical protein
VEEKKLVEVWRYVVRESISGNPFMWGEFLIASSGMFSAVSDYGNYSYAWRAFGPRDFRRFLLSMKNSPDYFMNKFDPVEVVDWTRTEQQMKRTIIDLRRRDQIHRYKARELWDAVHSSDRPEDVAACLEADEFYRWLIDDVKYRLSHQVEAFVKKLCIPCLLPMLERDLKA